ncbi:MAG: hypothetical protein WBW53_07540 [Terriglobales bacterium]
MKYKTIAVALFVTASILSLATVASAQKDPRLLGTIGSGFTPGLAHSQQAFTPLSTLTYTNASYGTGGVAMRNRIKGEIQISGVNGPTQDAWLYWAVLFQSSPSSSALKKAEAVTIQREYPAGAGSASVVVHGTLLAVGGDPCWGSAGTWVFRAQVPASVATGNGVYKIVLSGAATGLTDGEDPWDGNVVFPLAEGASLVIIGTGSATVGLYDSQAGTTFFSSQTNSYTLPGTFNSQALLDNFGYDGQIGSSRTISFSNETTTVTGSPSGTSVLVAGPGGETGDSDWDGSAGWPLPQLWDDTGHDISNALIPTDTAITVTYVPYGDCLGLVGSVISVQ